MQDLAKYVIVFKIKLILVRNIITYILKEIKNNSIP